MILSLVLSRSSSGPYILSHTPLLTSLFFVCDSFYAGRKISCRADRGQETREREQRAGWAPAHATNFT